ncbi:MAG: hypothetical protein JW806_09655 [Sedimentisphaerales bacterium]|nr:hypothetical protein [Sedimentisphaerales bacterium]
MAKAEAENVRDPLVSRAASDSAAFELLYDIYYEKIFSYCIGRIRFRQTAEDITSTAFLSAARDISRFKGTTRADFVNWLYTIATVKIDSYLKTQHIPQTSDSKSDTITWPLLHSAILKLGLKDQAVIVMRFFENIAISRIADIINSRSDLIRIRIAEVIDELKKIILLQTKDIELPETEKQFENLVKTLDIDNTPDAGHKARLRAKIPSVFGRRQAREYPSILYLAAGAALLLVLIIILWSYPANKTSITQQNISKQPETAVEADLPPNQEEISRLEKIKKLASEKNIPQLLEILKSDDIASRLLAAKFLAELTDSNLAEVIKIALPTEEINSDNRTEQMPPEIKTLLISTIDKKIDQPLPSVNLEILFDKWVKPLQVLTDEQGQYQFTLPQQKFNWFRISAAKEGYASMVVKQQDLKLSELFTLETIFFRMPEVITIGGIVQDEDFEPIENAEVRVIADFDDDEIDEMPKIDISGVFKTDVNGFWKCDTFPEDSLKAAIKASHPNYVSQETYLPATIEQLKNLMYITILEQGITVIGRATDYTEGPLSATITRGLYYNQDEKSVRCDKDGWFQFNNVPLGNEVFFAQCQGGAPRIQQVDVQPDMPPIIFVLEPAKTIRAKVVDIEGVPVENAVVEVSSWHGFDLLNFETTTDANGFFVWKDAPQDEVLFDISKPGYLSIRSFGMQSENDYVLTLLEPFEISGQVLSDNPDQPVKTFKIIVSYYQDDTGEILMERTNPTTFSGSEYNLVITEPFDFQLVLQANGFVPAKSPVFSAEQNVSEYDFILTPR